MPSWWRQQAWVGSTEVLLGFLAAWGLVQGYTNAWIPLGIGLAYAMDGFGVSLISRYGRSAAIGVAVFTLLCALASASLALDHRWWLLCMSAGGLLAFRDQQTMHAIAWMPVKALRRGGSSLMALVSGSVLSMLVLAVFLLCAGFLAMVWNEFPQAIAVGTCIFLLPQQIARMPQKPLSWRCARPLLVCEKLSWLLRLNLFFNAVNFLGRRIVLPIAVIGLASEAEISREALPLLGGVLGLMGLFGMLARLPFSMGKKSSGEAPLAWGARLSLIGWMCIGLGAALMSIVGAAWILLLSGWVLLEMTNKTWGTGYMEALRLYSVKSRKSASRLHRMALQKFMTYKSIGGAIGCGSAALLSPATAPLLVAGFAVGCLWWLENPPKDAVVVDHNN